MPVSGWLNCWTMSKFRPFLIANPFFFHNARMTSPFTSRNHLWVKVLSIYVPVAFIVVCVLSMYACMSGFVNQTQPLVMLLGGVKGLAFRPSSCLPCLPLKNVATWWFYVTRMGLVTWLYLFYRLYQVITWFNSPWFLWYGCFLALESWGSGVFLLVL